MLIFLIFYGHFLIFGETNYIEFRIKDNSNYSIAPISKCCFDRVITNLLLSFLDFWITFINLISSLN